MSVNPIDSGIFAALYASDEIRAIFSDRSHLQFMLDVEAALARAESAHGLVPAAAAEAITRVARVENLDLNFIAESTRRVGYPVVALVRSSAVSPATAPRATSILAPRLRISSTPRWYSNFAKRSGLSGATSLRSLALSPSRPCAIAIRRWPAGRIFSMRCR